MYEARVSFSFFKRKRQSMVVRVESHPEDVPNEAFQSIVYDNLCKQPMSLKHTDIRIHKVELLGDTEENRSVLIHTRKNGHARVLTDLGYMDYPLFRRQKRILVSHQATLTKKNAKVIDAIEGLLNLFDQIQDEAVKAGVPEKVVFEK